jgi:hypothetical protein
MNGYSVQAGTKSLLLKRIKLDEYSMRDWFTRNDMKFTSSACGINPDMLLMNPEKFNPNSLGVELAKEGYALFTDTAVFDKESNYIIAIPYKDVTLI